MSCLKLTACPLQVALLLLCIAIPAHAQYESGATTRVDSSTLRRVYQRWLVEDVRWIITPEEQIAFLRLSNDADRDRFIEQFWDRRNPHPDRPGNPFKDEHYRRIAYTNAHFASAGVPGWETDRGRIYILYGPPDRIHDGYTNTADRKPAQRWHYHFVGPYDVYDKDFRFVDVCNCGDYRLVAGRSEEPRLGP